MEEKGIAILGSTGFVGRKALEVVRLLKGKMRVKALSAHSNIDLLQKQIEAFHPEIVAVYSEEHAKLLKKRIKETVIVSGREGLEEIVSLESVNFVLVALLGLTGIFPVIRAIEMKKTIGLASKEILVAAGEYIMPLVKKKDALILPVDSEHSAIFQCLQNEHRHAVKRLILTASGGPFLHYKQHELEKVTPLAARSHPVWPMGHKISIDSSTLMNKGMEVIEAYHLFAIAPKQIEVVIHPQSIIHSFVEFTDHAMLAQLACPDMALPIQYALTYPNRKQAAVPSLDILGQSKWDFFSPDLNRFPCLRLAYAALQEGGSMPCFMNGANEVLVSRFLQGEIKWSDIAHKLDQLMEHHTPCPLVDLKTILAIDQCARQRALAA